MNISAHIIFEDNYLIAINKPAGLMVEEDRFGNDSLIGLLRVHLQKSSKSPVFLQNVHRLDRPVSGVVLFAKKKSALKNLSEQFASRKVNKIYVALTEKSPSQKTGLLSHYLFKDLKNKKAVISADEKKDFDKVGLEYEIKKQDKEKCLWEIKLLTGKYHQIRAQLSFVDCPIVGDEKYGSNIKTEENTIGLHARELRIIHPVTNVPIKFTAEFPANNLWTIDHGLSTKKKAKLLFYQKSSKGIKIFLGKIISKEGDEFWWLPGGGVENGETDLQGAMRELHEELIPAPYMVKAMEKFIVNKTDPPSIRYSTDKSSVIIFLIRLEENISLDELPGCREEFVEVKWFSLKDLPHNLSREYRNISGEMGKLV